jgi:hypothetical protein
MFAVITFVCCFQALSASPWCQAERGTGYWKLPHCIQFKARKIEKQVRFFEMKNCVKLKLFSGMKKRLLCIKLQQSQDKNLLRDGIFCCNTICIFCHAHGYVCTYMFGENVLFFSPWFSDSVSRRMRFNANWLTPVLKLYLSC